MAERADAADFIVVGAGTGGCALAARLAEDPGARIVLLESGGPDRHLFIQVPAAVAAAIGRPHLNWRFLSVPQPHLNNRRIPIPRGRVVGGSGSINGMVYFRGQPRDFDEWAEAGNAGWSYREVLPYFIRSESNADFAGSPFHGSAGPMRVTHIRRPNTLNYAFLEALHGLGFIPCADFNGPHPEGYGLRQGTIRDGRRESTATAYLRPALKRGNLQLLTHAHVSRVLIEGGRAVGVEWRGGDGVTHRLAARREIILCGGAILSPQILMLSGVGDAAELGAFGIPVHRHLPAVGANLHDHLAAAVLMEMHDSTSYGISVRATPRGAWNLIEYALLRRGPFASNVFESNAFVRSAPGLDRPDIQVVFQPARRNRSLFPLPLGHGFAVSIVGLYPCSRGRVRLVSADPATPPDIDPNLLAVPQDIEPLVRGLQLARRIVAAPSLARYRAREVAPGPEVRDAAGLADYVRRVASTVHHPVGSCRMGADAESVVDPQLRVHGIAALRIADASVFPRVVGGNTNATVVMIAEKAADMILGRAPPRPFDLTAAVGHRSAGSAGA